MMSIAAASRLLARLLSSPISAAVAASFGDGAARNSRPEEITPGFQAPAVGSIGWPATCWANDSGTGSNTQSPLRRMLATETRFIASSSVWQAPLASIALLDLHKLSGRKRPAVNHLSLSSIQSTTESAAGPALNLNCSESKSSARRLHACHADRIARAGEHPRDRTTQPHKK